MRQVQYTKSAKVVLLSLLLILKIAPDNNMLHMAKVALAQVSAPNISNILRYPSPYILHTPLPDSISTVIHNGIEFQQFLVRKDDPAQPQWGDGADGQLRKRAQIVPLYRNPLGTIKNISFLFLVPDDWKLNTQPVLIANGHSVNLKAGPWALYIKNDQLQFTLSVDNPNGNKPNEVKDIFDVVNEKYPLILNHLYEFRLVMLVANDTSGYAQVFIDGNKIADYKGPTVSTNERGLPYEKFGPYIFSRNLDWPFPDQDYKRILMRFY